MSHRRRAAWLFVMGIACGPAPADDTSPSSSTSAGEATSGSISASTTEPTSVGTSSGAADDTSSTGDAAIDCADFIPDACPVGCMSVTAYPGTFDSVQLGPSRDMCIASGAELDPAYRSSWWTESDAELWFVESGIQCAQGHLLHATPAEWSECTGADDDPAPCRRRFCALDVCPGETDVEVFESCELEEPCGESMLPSAPDCLLGALRDRIPGRYPVRFGYPNQDVDWLLVVDDDGSVRATYIDLFGIVCAEGIWQPARTCQLADPQALDDCIGVQGEICLADALSFYPWLLDCVDEPASCP